MTISNYFLLEEKVQHGIRDKLGWNNLTPIQEQTIPHILNGDNCVLLAETAGGKTEAAFLPIINQIYKDNLKVISVIYVSPLRALLNNQELRLNNLGKIVGIEAFKWHGEVEYTSKRKFNIEPKHILATTPESLEVMLMSDSYDKQSLFSNIRFIVIDEVHYFAENYRGTQLMSIIERIQSYSKYDIQRIGLSATIGNPEEILDWISGSSNRDKKVIKTMGESKKTRIFVRYFDEINDNTMKILLPELKNKKSLFFCNSRTGSEKTANTLKKLGLNARVHHSSISRGLREVTEEKLKDSSLEMCLCCTSTMELGIDVGELDLIMQLNSPSTVASFRQRMGRTGRRPGTISHYEFCVDNEFSLVNAIALIELARGKWIESSNISLSAYTVLFQQVVSMIEQKFGLNKTYLDDIVNGTLSFGKINSFNLDDFMDYLLQNRYIEYSNEEYILGTNLEEKYGSNIMMNFISNFETMMEYSIIYKNKEIGYLQGWFVQVMLKENQNASFILAGNTWAIDKIDHEKSKIYVKKAKSGELAIWFGSGTIVSYEIAKEMFRIMNANEEYPYIDNKSKAILKSIRIEHSALGLKENEILIDVVHKGFDIYTFAGHKVNFTLGLILNQQFGFEFSMGYDKLSLKKGDKGINENHILNFLKEVKNDKNKIEKMAEKALISSEYISRTKFYEDLPRFAQIEILKHELVDIENTEKLLRESEIIMDMKKRF